MKISETIGKRKVDDDAETISDIAKKTGLSREAVRALKEDGVKSGAWEEVWKHDAIGRLVKAYRSKRKK